MFFFFFFQAEDGIRDGHVTGVQTCALPIWRPRPRALATMKLATPVRHGRSLARLARPFRGPHSVDWLAFKGFIVHWLALKGFIAHFSMIPRRSSPLALVTVSRSPHAIAVARKLLIV